VPRITDFCSCVYVLGCKLSLVRLCDSDFGITPTDDITIGVTCAAFGVLLLLYYYYYLRYRWIGKVQSVKTEESVVQYMLWILLWLILSSYSGHNSRNTETTTSFIVCPVRNWKSFWIPNLWTPNKYLIVYLSKHKMWKEKWVFAYMMSRTTR